MRQMPNIHGFLLTPQLGLTSTAGAHSWTAHAFSLEAKRVQSFEEIPWARIARGDGLHRAILELSSSVAPWLVVERPLVVLSDPGSHERSRQRDDYPNGLRLL